METLVIKINVAQMKADIKKLAEEQKFLKNQMKTVRIVGERKMDAKDAWAKHHYNRQDLRAMYAAYGIARGKKYSQIENHYPEENHPLHDLQRKIDRLSEPYKYLVEVPVLE